MIAPFLLHLALVLFPADEAPPESRTFTFDVVARHGGEEQAGRPDLFVDHDGYRYLFAEEASRQAFLEDTARFEVQLGGGCGRMGPMSGRGRTEIHAIHEGRLYVFASESCRETFLERADDLLDPDQEAPAPDADGEARAKRLLDAAAEALGGLDRLASLASYEELSRRRVTTEVAVHDTGERLVLGAGGGVRLEEWWDDWRRVLVLTDEAAFEEDADGRRPLARARARALGRRSLRHPLALLLKRGEAGFRAASLGPGEVGGRTVERVDVGVLGTRTVLGIDPTSHRIVAAVYRGRGPRVFFGERVDLFDDFREVDGLQVPFSRLTLFEGEAAADGPRVLDEVVIDAPRDEVLGRP